MLDIPQDASQHGGNQARRPGGRRAAGRGRAPLLGSGGLASGGWGFVRFADIVDSRKSEVEDFLFLEIGKEMADDGMHDCYNRK